MTTARDIATRALKLLQYYAEGETPTPAAIADSLQAFNSLVASWHNDGLLIFYPPNTNWLGEWKKNYVYAVDDSVYRNGASYTCSVAHTSSANDLPGSSANWADYWTLYAETPMTLASTIPFDASHERGLVALVAQDLAPQFGVEISRRVAEMAREGLTAIYGQYFRIPEAASDPGITRMPSQIWPYSIPSVS